jgi:hypothetical protein
MSLSPVEPRPPKRTSASAHPLMREHDGTFVRVSRQLPFRLRMRDRPNGSPFNSPDVLMSKPRRFSVSEKHGKRNPATENIGG